MNLEGGRKSVEDGARARPDLEEAHVKCRGAGALS